MKKQILILVLFVLATFANVSKSYGQTELTPIPGTDYDYIVSGTPAGGTYAWTVYDDGTNLLTGTQTVAATYYVAVSGVATADFKVNWKPAAVGKTFYLVVQYSTPAAVPAACTVMNMKVFEVKPVNTFLLTMTLAKSDGSPNAISDVCPPAIVSAAVSGTDVKMDYGTTTLYYNVKAEGLVGVWKPTVRIPALGATQTYQSVKWGATDMGAATTGAQQDLTLASDVAVTIGGSNYLVEVVIKNNAYETTTAQIISPEVDGLLGADHTVSDILAAGSATLADPLGGLTVKKATYSITARPAITSPLLPVPGFMPIVP